MQREIHLTDDGVQEELGMLFPEENSIGYDENRRRVFRARRNELVELGMNKRVPHEVKTNLVGDRSHLGHNIRKQIGIHHPFRPHDLGTKAALKIADITDLNVNFSKAFRTSFQEV